MNFPDPGNVFCNNSPLSRRRERPNYLMVLLSADDGPRGTKDYRIVLEAVPLDR